MHAVSALRRVGGFLFSGDGRYHGAAWFNGETDGGSVFAIDDDVGKGWGAYDFDATGERKPREIAMALTAWFTAPAPTAWIST